MIWNLKREIWKDMIMPDVGFINRSCRDTCIPCSKQDNMKANQKLFLPLGLHKLSWPRIMFSKRVYYDFINRRQKCCKLECFYVICLTNIVLSQNWSVLSPIEFLTAFHNFWSTAGLCMRSLFLDALASLDFKLTLSNSPFSDVQIFNDNQW